MAIPNFFWQFSQKGLNKNGHSKFIQTFLVQKDWKKFGMAKNGFWIYLNLSSAKRLEEI